MSYVYSRDKGSDIYKIIGERIQKRREQLNMSQSDLADAIGIGYQHQTISRWESGNRFYLDHIDELCKALDCDHGYLFGMYDDPKMQYHDIRHATNLTVEASQCIENIKDNDEYISFISALIYSFSGLIINKIRLIKDINAQLKEAEENDKIRTDLEEDRDKNRWLISKELEKLVDWYIADMPVS